MDLKEQAKQDYLAGVKIKDIAQKIGKSASTIRSWKSRYKWDDVSDRVAKDATKSVATKRNKNATQHKNVATSQKVDQVIDELADSDLTDKQKAFVLEFVRISNATQAYINAYDSTYNVARVNGSRMLTNANIQKAIATLRKAKMHDLSIDTFDLIKDLAKEARADIGDFLDFGNYDVIETDMNNDVQLDINDEPIVSRRSWVQFKDKNKVDTSLIKNISMGKDGPKIELFDRDKARKQLLDYLVQIEAVSNNNQQVVLSDSTKERMASNGKD